MTMTKADVYDFVAARGTPSRLPGLWEHQKCYPSIFDLVDEPGKLLAALQKEFGPAALAKAGITGRDSSGAITLSGLGPTRKYIAALRRAPDKKPFDLMAGERGSVAGRWAWQAAMADHQIAAQIGDFGRQLLITTSDENVAVLRSSGFPVAPVHGLAGFRGDRLKQFCTVLNLRSPEANSPSADARERNVIDNESVAMILVNWSAAQLDLTDIPEILAVRDFLRNIKRYCAMRMANFTIWKPSAAELERILFCVQYGTNYEVWLAMDKSMQKSCRTLNESVAEPRRLPTTYAEAVTDWMRLPESADDGGAKMISWERVQEFHNAEVVEPLLKDALRMTDHVERTRMITHAELVRKLHPQLLRSRGDVKEITALVDRLEKSAPKRGTWQRTKRSKRA